MALNIYSKNHGLNVSDKNKTTQLDEMWMINVKRETYKTKIEKQEALFCFILILTRILMPQKCISWNNIINMNEYTFNTILDINFTLIMCRDAKLEIPRHLIIWCFIISSCALLTTSLNVFTDTDSYIDKSQCVSYINNITDNFYFRYIVQILLTDMPFLILRINILMCLKFIKKEIYYLILKQVVIIACKLIILVKHFFDEMIRNLKQEELSEINNLFSI